MPELNWYLLDPIDLLLMREAKPFSPGDGSWAKGQFPPLPITVFQAMRSATAWQDGGDRTARNLEFIGPFLLHAPPGAEPTLWLPTPQDLVCVSSRKTATDGDADDDSEEDFTETATQWERTARFQPLDHKNEAWKYLGLDPEFFPPEQLAPMVPPMRARTDQKRNDCLCQTADGQEHIAGRPEPWIRADALIRYLKDEVLNNPNPENKDGQKTDTYFHKNPWTTQVLPHIKVQPGTRQVQDEEGYFTEVAIRMEPHWHLVAGISTELEAKVVRLGGEGHRALVMPMGTPPHWEDLWNLRSPSSDRKTAYALTPGLAEVAEDHFGLIPEDWKPHLRSCVGERPLLWGGMSVFQKQGSKDKSVAFQPQRAFVPPGTVYQFKPDHPVRGTADKPPRLLPQADDNWSKTFKTLNYGTLLWGK